MNRKQLVAAAMGALMLISVGMAGAQEPERPFRDGDFRERDRVVLEVVAEATGLTEAEIIRLWRQEDMTLADIITSNGGDLAAVEADLNAALTAEINERMEINQERAQNALDNLDTAVDNLLNGRPSERRPDNLRDAVAQAIQEATGLEEAALREQLEAGQTLAQIAAENGVDVTTITEAIKADATERTNTAVAEGRITQEEADERLARLDEHLDRILNTTLAEAVGDRLVEGALLRAVRDNLTLERGDLRNAPDDQTLGDFITAQGGDLATITAEAQAHLQTRITELVADGRLTQPVADDILAGAEATITEKLNAPFKPLRPGRDRR